MTDKQSSAPRCAALVGPYLSGKTTLLESILFICGAIGRRGSVGEGNTVGDASPEARAREMSTELNVANAEYLGETWTFLDCPGSIELSQDAYNAVMVADAAVVVCEPSADKALTIAPFLKFLDDCKIPTMLFLNKMDHPESSAQATVEAIKAYTERPLVLRQVPIREGDAVTGFVELAGERAFKWQGNQPSERIDMPDSVKDRVEEARQGMLESLADFDDVLLEKLLEDETPSIEEVYGYTTKVFREGGAIPVLFGASVNGNGVRRLLKALRHETPGPAEAAQRLGFEASGGDAVAQVFKTTQAGQTGKLSMVRVASGEIADGMTLNGTRVGGLFRMLGKKQEKIAKAGPGEVAGLARMEGVKTGDTLSPSGGVKTEWPAPLKPFYSMSVDAEKQADEVKLPGALAKLADEDPSFSFEAVQDTGELLIWGQGDQHLQIAVDRLRNRYSLEVTTRRPRVPYKETITKAVSQHARHKKQSGGHGQFGDVHVDIKPLPRGSGFSFDDSISGGVVPKQYIPSVATGVKDYMARGPLGFPVVDIVVTLTDGQFHAVDSSDMAFKAAAQLAMREGMPKCGPVLLEPIFRVRITLPNEFTSKVQRVISGRRGQILGFDAKPGWTGWDEVSAQMPQSEMHDLINELRSITLGVGTFEREFDHLQEITGRLADDIVAQRQAEKK